MKDKLLYGTRLCAVEHAVNSDGEDIFICLLLEKKKSELVKIDSKKVSELEEVLEFLNNQLHVFLIINNNQVLSKRSEIVFEDDLKTIKNSFLNIQINDFYYEVVKVNDYSFSAICRKDVVDKYIALYNEKSITVIDVSLGNMSSIELIPFIEEEKLYTSNAEIEIIDNSISTFTKGIYKKVDYIINGLAINSYESLSLAGIIKRYIKKVSSQKQLSKKLSNIYLHKRVFSTGYKVALGFIFLILMVNFLVFNSYHRKLNQIQEELQVNESYKNQLLSLKRVVNTKEKLVEGITNSSNANITKRIDQLLYKMPTSILLEEFNYQPLAKKIKEGEVVKVNLKEILVSGTVTKNADFTKWVDSIENLSWINQVKIVQFGKENVRQNPKTSFKILIQIK